MAGKSERVKLYFVISLDNTILARNSNGCIEISILERSIASSNSHNVFIVAKVFNMQNIKKIVYDELYFFVTRLSQRVSLSCFCPTFDRLVNYSHWFIVFSEIISDLFTVYCQTCEIFITVT